MPKTQSVLLMRQSALLSILQKWQGALPKRESDNEKERITKEANLLSHEKLDTFCNGAP